MTLKDYYREIKRSIVAFCPKYTPLKKPLPPEFPHIIGTGFVVKEEGLIVTNAHVAKAFNKFFRPPGAPEGEWPVIANLFKQLEKGLVEIPLEVLGVVIITHFESKGVYYGPKEGPDIAFVHVKAMGLDKVEIDDSSLLEEGLEVATAGFPMGTEALTAPGWLHQIAPTLQRGIISAIQPYAVPSPHSFSVNIMTQGGASGSPIFSCETGKVLGVLNSGLHDLEISIKNKDIYRVPTNISYVVPSHYITKALKRIESNPDLKLPPDTKSIDEMLSEAELVNRFDWKPIIKKMPTTLKTKSKIIIESPEA